MEISSPPFPASLSPRRSCDSSTSLEFEFNPTFSSPTALPSADQLFFGGIILPLHLLPNTHHHNSDSSPPGLPPDPDPDPDPNPPFSSANAKPVSVSNPPGPAPDSDASPSILSAGITASKRWRDIFKKGEKKPPTEENKDKEKNKEKEKEKKRVRKKGGSAAGNSAELNINLWPFSRSRSAGNKAAGNNAARKVSSAPCSRSNSAGESKSRLWPSSPARNGGGVHLGRTSPVWLVPRTVSSRAEKGKKETGEVNPRSKAVKGGASAGGATSSNGRGKDRVLNINVPMCIGYRHHLSCRSDETGAIGSGGGGVGDDSGRQGGAGSGPRTVGNSGGNLFNLRSLFSKNVY